MKAWSSYRDQGLAEWRSNRRLRLAALLALAVAGGQVLIHLSESRAGLAQEYRREAALLERLVEASRDEAWPARAVEAEAQLEAMRQSVPEMSSSGLAQAELQTWLTGLAQRNGLPAPRVRVETTIDVPGHPELWQVLARLDVEGTDASLAPVLEALAGARPWIQTDLIDIQRTSAGTGGVRLGLLARAYYRKPSEAGGDAAQEVAAPASEILQAPDAVEAPETVQAAETLQAPEELQAPDTLQVPGAFQAPGALPAPAVLPAPGPPKETPP